MDSASPTGVVDELSAFVPDRPRTTRRRLLSLTGLVLGAAAASPALLPPSAASAATNRTSLAVGEQLNVGEYLQSANGTHTLIYQPDGNLVLYEDFHGPNQIARWASNTVARPGDTPAFCRVNRRGVLLVCVRRSGSSVPVAVWVSSAFLDVDLGYLLVMQDDGNAVIYQYGSQARWASNTMRTYANTTLNDVKASVDAVIKHRAHPDYKFNTLAYGFVVTAHIQGMGLYRDRWLFTNNSGHEGWPGFWVVGHDSSDNLDLYGIWHPRQYTHPSSFQIVGDFAVGGVEKDDKDNTDATLYFWDLEPTTKGAGPRRLASPVIERNHTGGAAATGMAWYQGAHVLAVFTTYDNSVSFYRSNGFPLGDSRLDFGPELFRVKNTKNMPSYDNMNLHTGADGKLYLIGMRGNETKTQMQDFVSVGVVDMDRGSYTELEYKHVYTDAKTLGKIGPHLRYGAGTQVRSPNEISMFCSQRSFVVPLFNFFRP